jgi:hypothetical protein
MGDSSAQKEIYVSAIGHINNGLIYMTAMDNGLAATSREASSRPSRWGHRYLGGKRWLPTDFR